MIVLFIPSLVINCSIVRALVFVFPSDYAPDGDCEGRDGCGTARIVSKLHVNVFFPRYRSEYDFVISKSK